MTYNNQPTNLHFLVARYLPPLDTFPSDQYGMPIDLYQDEDFPYAVCVCGGGGAIVPQKF